MPKQLHAHHSHITLAELIPCETNEHIRIIVPINNTVRCYLLVPGRSVVTDWTPASESTVLTNQKNNMKQLNNILTVRSREHHEKLTNPVNPTG
jgi:hypothetical protein